MKYEIRNTKYDVSHSNCPYTYGNKRDSPAQETRPRVRLRLVDRVDGHVRQRARWDVRGCVLELRRGELVRVDAAVLCKLGSRRLDAEVHDAEVAVRVSVWERDGPRGGRRWRRRRRRRGRPRRRGWVRGRRRGRRWKRRGRGIRRCRRRRRLPAMGGIGCQQRQHFIIHRMIRRGGPGS